MNDKTTIKKFRSPPYPFLNIGRAIERAAQLFQKAQHYPVGQNVLANAWGFSPQSSGLLKSAAALIQYGLVKDQGSGDARKFQLTEAARRILQDADPNSERRKALIRAAALSPTIHKELWEKFGNPAELSDALLKNHLLIDRTEVGEAPFSQASSNEVIQTYRDALAFAELDKAEESLTADSNGHDDRSPQQPPEQNGAMIVAFGDLIQWESGGVLQFKQPKRVRWISEDGAWIAVEGSDNGIPASEVILEKKATLLPEIPRQEVTHQPVGHVSGLADPQLQETSSSFQIRKDVFALDEGEVTLTMPSQISKDSFDDFSDWLDLMKRKVQRNVRAVDVE
ncbi:hypothetical protein [Agrobacterium sp. lyk4-40-TYG-31]|uniref:hypothetical protein n=1 Tax=Agrobacterium sp. lyk4-40-TYG-31 TaxID=3040276 RepID=UPI00254E395B|nr:hypothetical protein [Agrobacterium sp. lyk4-40-TYG-31]